MHKLLRLPPRVQILSRQTVPQRLPRLVYGAVQRPSLCVGHRHAAALALWRGEPHEGSDYIWADGHINRLRATLLGLLERAGHARLERGDARGALQMAEQAIAPDQFHEASWRPALQAEDALGMRESITRRYDELAHALDQELGLQPTRETRVMYRQLLGQN